MPETVTDNAWCVGNLQDCTIRTPGGIKLKGRYNV